VSLLPFFHWLAATHLGIAMRDSTWAFAIVEVVHLIVLAVFGGAIIFLDLRFLGFGFTSVSAPEMAREMLPITAGGAVVMFLTGFLLLSSGPMRYYYNTPFRAKMLLFLVAVVFHFVLQVRIAGSRAIGDRATALRRFAAIVSLFLWSSVGLAGRAIGYF
jgi:hypothetical protein